MARQHAIERKELDEAMRERHKQELACMHQQLLAQSAETKRQNEKTTSALEELARRRAVAKIGEEFYRQAVEDEATIKAMEKDIKEAEKKAEQAEDAALVIQKEARTNTAEYHAKKETTNTQGK